MNEKEGLNLLDFLATGINKEDEVIKAVLSNNQGEGAIANELETVSDFIDYYSSTGDVINHAGDTLEMIVKLFSKFRRRLLETDDVLLRRFLAITERKGDTIWGNTLNIKHVFETYFKDILCYVAENTNDISLLKNGDFEEDELWILENGAKYSYIACFSGKRGLYFNGAAGQTCMQELERLITGGNYTFHFFLEGKCGLIIQRDDGKYWNANAQKFSGAVILEWVNDEIINIFESHNAWDDVFCFIKIPEDIHKITFKFTSVTGYTAKIDYARFFEKPLNPTYTLLFRFTGFAVFEKSLHTSDGSEDPIEGINYDDESYFDHAFIVGPIGVSQSKAFTSVLDIVRPRGIQVFTEFVENNIDEEEI